MTKKRVIANTANMGQPKKYPWDKWFDGRSHTLVPGKHFSCSVRSMIVYIYTRARKRGQTVQVNETAKGLVMTATAPAKKRA